eukprot:6170683-Prymnesium_polylepis.1
MPGQLPSHRTVHNLPTHNTGATCVKRRRAGLYRPEPKPLRDPAGGRLGAALEDGGLGADVRACGGGECGGCAQPGEAGSERRENV